MSGPAFRRALEEWHPDRGVANLPTLEDDEDDDDDDGARTMLVRDPTAQLQKAGIPADIIPAKTHAEGLAMIDSGKTSAYFADRSILMFLVKDAKDPGKLFIADNYLTVEPYALALPRGDDKFRLAVDTALERGEEISIARRIAGEGVFRHVAHGQPLAVVAVLGPRQHEQDAGDRAVGAAG